MNTRPMESLVVNVDASRGGTITKEIIFKRDKDGNLIGATTVETPVEEPTSKVEAPLLDEPLAKVITLPELELPADRFGRAVRTLTPSQVDHLWGAVNSKKPFSAEIPVGFCKSVQAGKTLPFHDLVNAAASDAEAKELMVMVGAQHADAQRRKAQARHFSGL